MSGFDSLGAAETLSNQYITVRVKGIDSAKLGKAVGYSGLIGPALTMVNAQPRAALDALLPIAAAKAKEFGVDADIVVSNVPPSKGGRTFSEFWGGLGIGIVLGGAGLIIVKAVGGLVGKITGR